MIVDDNIVITVADRTNPLWGKMMDMWNQRLQTLRMLNDRPQSEVETAVLRGAIREIKSMIGKNDDVPIVD